MDEGTIQLAAQGRASSRLRSVDALRGCAALAVVVFHAIRYAEPPQNSPLLLRGAYAVFSQGHLGVPLFFVISGFCIHLGCASRFKRTGKLSMDWFAFWRRRMKRLYPAYFAALLIAMALVVIAYVVRPSQAIITQYPQPRLQWIGLDFLSHALMLHGFIPLFDTAGGNPAFWTLAREEYLYAMYALLLLFRKRLGLPKMVSVVAILGIAFQTLVWLYVRPTGQVADTLYSSAVSLWIQWCLGLVAAEAFVGNCRIPRVFCSLWSVPVFWTLASLSTTFFHVLAPTLWGLTFFTLLNAAISLEAADRWPNGRFAEWFARVGIFSYSLYLIHIPARTAVKYVLIYSGWNRQGVVAYTLTVAIMTIAGYYSARLFFWLVEQRCLGQGQPEQVPQSRNAAAATR